MPTTLQFRRGTTSQNNAFTGAAGEITIDTDTNEIRIHDGSSAGGATIGGGAAATITLVATNSTDATHFPVFVDTATGDENPRTDTGFTYNPSSGTLTSTIFAGTANQAKYADLAEMYESEDSIDAGTVVMFVGQGKVASCNEEDCRSVAGIISTDPAYLMNSEQVNGVPLALTGRTPCKVTGSVKAGDLMVSAGNGMAKANNDAKPGTIIGKAIEDNEDGDNTIEVLITMM
jgi:hypothetical protein